jgi:hypothetical protein
VYAWIWRRLPGPTAVKAVEALLLAVVVVLLLFIVVFPWLEPRLPFNDVTIDETPTTSVSAPASSPASSLPPKAPGTPTSSSP